MVETHQLELTLRLYFRFIADFCPNLIHLNMENCFIGSEIALSILMLKCHRLEYLRLPFFSLHRSSNNNGDSGEDTPSSKILTALVKGRHNLKSFGLYMWHVDLDPYLKPLLERCPELTDLNLTGCSRIKRSLISSFTRIQRLNLTANSKIDDRFLKDLSCLPPSSLKWLDLSHCKVTHIGIDHIVEGCQRLESLILNFNGKLDLCHLKTTSLSLRHLAVCQSPCIGNCCMSVVKQRFPRLSSIDFSHCADVSDRLELQRLVLAMPSLERVGLSCCDRLFAHPQQQQQSSTSSTTAVSTTNNRFERAFALLHGKRKSNACSLQEQGRLGCFDVRIWSDPHPRKIDWYERLSGHNGERYCVISKKLNEFKLADFSNAIYL